MPVTVGDIVNALDALGGEPHYKDIAEYILANGIPPFPADPAASVRARLQERCSDYQAYKGQADLFESEENSGIWRFRRESDRKKKVEEERAEYEVDETNRVLRVHLQRERDAKLISKFKAGLAEARCEACGMMFAETYGGLAEGYIEAHHKTPLEALEEGQMTKVSDLAPLCANCHRVVHRSQNMAIAELTKHLADNPMKGGSWKKAVSDAVSRYTLETGSRTFSRQAFIKAELANVIAEVCATSETPAQTLSRVLQELRDDGFLLFLGEGVYKILK